MWSFAHRFVRLEHEFVEHSDYSMKYSIQEYSVFNSCIDSGTQKADIVALLTAKKIRKLYSYHKKFRKGLIRLLSLRKSFI
jgi:hypothetical protein